MHTTTYISALLLSASVVLGAPWFADGGETPEKPGTKPKLNARDGKCILAGYSNTHRSLGSCGGTGASLLTCAGDNESGWTLWGTGGGIVAETSGNSISNKGVNIKAKDLKLPKDLHWLAPNDLGLSMDSCYVDYNGGHFQGKRDDNHNPCGKSGITKGGESKTCFSCAVEFPCEAK